MKKLYKYLKPYLHWTLIAPFFMLCEVFMDILQPMLMSRIINEGIIAGGDDATRFIWTTCGKMLACALLGVVGGVGNMYFSTKAGYGFSRDLRKALYQKIQSFSFANIDRFKTGSLVTRVTNDVVQIQNAFTNCIRMLVRSPFLCIGGIIAIYAINTRLALVVSAALPVLIAVITLIMSRAFPLFARMQEKLDRINVIMQENLAGVRVIKAFGRSEYEKNRFKKANDEMIDVNTRAMRLMAVSFPMVNLIMNIALIVMYYVGGNMVISGDAGLSAGDIMAFSNYVMQILMSLTMSSMMLMFVSRAKVSVDRVNEVLDTPVDIVGGDSEAKVTRGRVEFRDVVFSYPGQAGAPVLDHISFAAEPGETVAILGATGSGKTSLISLIPRLYDVTGGDVLIDGVNVRDYKLAELRGQIGVALQESVLFTGSVDENLHWGDDHAGAEIIRVATEVAQVNGFIESMTDGYDTMLGQRGVNLSGGQKQRLSIARALVKHPKILILDDSTSAVDLATEAEIQKGLREVMGDLTMFIIAQRVSSVIDADKIIVMENGRVVDIGKHNELKKRCDVYREIVVSQLGEEAA